MKKNDLLKNINGQISNFDNKASILLTVVGFVVAFTTSFIGLLDKYKGLEAVKKDTQYYFLVIFLIIYFLTLLISGSLFVGVIFPRKRDKKSSKSNTYYVDIAENNFIDYKYIESTDENYDSQILMNSKICLKKHKLTVWGIFFLCISTIFLLAIIVLAIFN